MDFTTIIAAAFVGSQATLAKSVDTVGQLIVISVTENVINHIIVLIGNETYGAGEDKSLSYKKKPDTVNNIQNIECINNILNMLPRDVKNLLHVKVLYMFKLISEV